jgi:hypothetical protein
MVRIACPSINSHDSKSAKTITPFPSIFPFNYIELDWIGYELSHFFIILTSSWSS